MLWSASCNKVTVMDGFAGLQRQVRHTGLLPVAPGETMLVNT